jgi:hypothetical protein
MAIDADTRIKVQVVYESNNWSPREVKENRFSDNEEIKQKTIESWVMKFGWIKNRFASEIEAINNLIDASLPLEEIKELIKNKMKNETNEEEVIKGELVGKDNDESDDMYMQEMGKELAYKVLNAHSLQIQMAQNLDKTKVLAERSNSIGVKKTYHDMLTKTYEVVHGRNINITPVNPKDKTITPEEIQNKTDEELNALIKGL